jgi:hypothetical protein
MGHKSFWDFIVSDLSVTTPGATGVSATESVATAMESTAIAASAASSSCGGGCLRCCRLCCAIHCWRHLRRMVIVGVELVEEMLRGRPALVRSYCYRDKMDHEVLHKMEEAWIPKGTWQLGDAGAKLPQVEGGVFGFVDVRNNGSRH